MTIIIVGIILFIIIYNLKYKKYKNPYKLIMVFGKKGSGKSTFLIKQAKYYIKKKYNVYTNMQDCMVDGVRIFNIEELGKSIPEKNSVVLIDEAGIVYDNRNFRKFTEEQRDFYKYQRHYQLIVILASQTFDIDKKLRDLVDEMILIQNIGIVYTLLRPIKKTITLTEATSDGESRIAENLKFRSPLSWRIFKNVKYSRYFESFVTPYKPELNYIVRENSNITNSKS